MSGDPVKNMMQDTVRANALDASWLPSFKGIKVLSLDCFDTLLWRKVGQPTDVFFALAQGEEFRRHGLTAPLRVRAESNARKIRWVETRTSFEVSIEQIYGQALPAAEPSDIAALVNAEIDCEARYCFIFKPVFDLVVQARALGLKVVIVSDTYLGSAQLRKLLVARMPQLDGLVDEVFCSSQHGLSKGEGIWKKVLPLLGVKPDEVLHLGDNEDADFRSPQRFGMRAVHLVHHEPDTHDMLAGRAQVAVQLFPEVRYRAPLPSYHHAQLAAAVPADPQHWFGYASVGPILHAFADFVLREVVQLASEGASVRVAFLLRDGFLPARACAALAGEQVGCELNISRFTAIAASLRGREDVVGLMTRSLNRDSMAALARQLLLPAEVAQRILAEARRASLPEARFVELVLEKATLDIVVDASREFRKRLLAHVRARSGARPGDTLVFVDLGYSGTAQTLLKDILREELGVNLVGRYLLADEVAPAQPDRKGLVDSTRVDGRIVKALTGDNIACFEMLCTQAAPSTVDYTADGEPLFSEAGVGEGQHAAVAAIQAGCLQFIAEARAGAPCHRPRPDEHEVARAAAIDLARLLYCPTPPELECMGRFQFDFNLGTDHNMALFDFDAALSGMRRQGFGYMEANLSHRRMSYALELRFLDLSLSQLLFSSNRFGFGMKLAGASYRSEEVEVLVTNAGGHVMEKMAATGTYDGYYSLCVPLASTFDVGILLGKRYSWVQVDSVQMIRDNRLHEGVDMEVGTELLIDGMQHHENGLFECDEAGMLYLPGLASYGGRRMCRVVFRPIAYRNT